MYTHVQRTYPNEHEVDPPPSIPVARRRGSDRRSDEGSQETPQRVARVDEAQPAVRNVTQAPDERVGVRVLVPHAQALQQEGRAEERQRAPRAQEVGCELQDRADAQELAERQVRRQDGVGDGGDEPPGEGHAVTTT